jgi:hypothetical protein
MDLKPWQIRAKELLFEEKHSWDEVYSTMKKEYPEECQKDAKIRSFLRRCPEYSGDRKEQPEDINGEIIQQVTKGATLQQLSKSVCLSERVTAAMVDDLRDKGYGIELNRDGLYKLQRTINTTVENIVKKAWKGEKLIRFGLCGDTQHNNKCVQITHQHTLYDIFEREGIKDVYHSGDVDDGEKMHKGHEYELYNHGIDSHVKEIKRVYPKRNGITTHIITGNHDLSYFKALGCDIGKMIAAERDDIKYLGQNSAVIYLTPNCTLELRHPGDGTSYAISYKSEKLLDSLMGGEKPNIMAIGHYHKSEYIFYRNVHCIQTGCLEAQTPFMKSKSIAAMMGGWIIEVHVNDEGNITRIKQEFIPFYRAIKDDYKNWQ